MPESKPLQGRTAIVTGAGRGMGRACAQALAGLGARLVINDLEESSAEETVRELHTSGTRAAVFQADITDAPGVHAMVDWAVESFGSADILVNNAGVLYPTKVLDISEEEWDRVIDVNLKGTFICCQAVLPHMQTSGWGRIINFSSTAGKNVSTVGGAHYTAAKAGILGFTRHLAKEVASYGITVNAVCPGLIDTEMVRTTITEERIQAYEQSFPIPRLGRPEEVADLVAFLSTDKAAYITGASLDINGGDLMI
ncbi:MAG: SDR family NAD(P)-dependent oxidoreductase [bacterium]|nr:SDR family NAD(P)-dependent oxidoreductase [bacterium]